LRPPSHGTERLHARQQSTATKRVTPRDDQPSGPEEYRPLDDRPLPAITGRYAGDAGQCVGHVRQNAFVSNGGLFRGGYLREYLQKVQARAVSQVARAAPDEVRFAPDALTERLFEEHRVAPVTFDYARITRTEPREESETIEQWGERYSIPIHVISVVVPMTGDSELLRRQASTHSLGVRLQATLRTDALVFSISGRELTPEAALGQVNAMKAQLTQSAEWANADVAGWEPQLHRDIEVAVANRKQRLDDAASLSANLDIPLVATSQTERVSVPVARKSVRIEQTASRSSTAKMEPHLADAMYEDVLRTLGSLARALERLPRTASRFKEEELRDLALFILNSNYEGAARGEVFNGNGKTDLLLAWRDRNAFIGECKFWKGPKGFTDAIDQLMGYLVWQDTKAALILFIKDGEPTEVIEKADKTVRAHVSFRSACEVADPVARRDYVMVSASDSQRYIKLALLPVVVPKIASSAND
jgi:hypothetical protein